MNHAELVKAGQTLALDLATDGLNEYSDLAQDMMTALADLTRWEWLPRGRGVALCRGGLGVVSVWHSPTSGWCLRWLDDGQMIDRIQTEDDARHTAEQIARSRGVLGAGEVVK